MSHKELWVTDGGELKAIDPASGETRVLQTVAPRRFSASLAIDRRAGDAYSTVVDNEADIWLVDLTGSQGETAASAESR